VRDAYQEFLEAKAQLGTFDGFEAAALPGFLFDFQEDLVAWALRKGKAAIFADCGLGKTPMQLAWADAVVRHTNKPVLILTPLAVAAQTVAEAEKFGIEARRSQSGEVHRGINVTNYERLHFFNRPTSPAWCATNPAYSSRLTGTRRGAITEFMRTLPYRLLCTATAAPNDYIELGTSSEALGSLGYMDMLMRFFKNDQNTIKPMVYRHRGKNFAGAGRRREVALQGSRRRLPFWRWVCSWARAFAGLPTWASMTAVVLPPLVEHEHLVSAASLADGMLLPCPPSG
jgi:hypothetical protein